MRVRHRWVSVASASAAATVVGVCVSGAAATALTREAPSPCTRAVTVATWSPDGKRIAFVGRGGRSTAVCVAHTDGTHAHPLPQTYCPRRGRCSLIITPEDLHWAQPSRLVYSDAAKCLFAVPLTGKPKRFGESTDSYGTVSIDVRGDRVAYGSAAGPGERVPITVLSVPSGSVVGKIGGPTTDNVFPSLSPDGKRVVFIQATDTSLTTLVASVTGSNEQALEQCGGQPVWSPTGDNIACPGTGSLSSALLLVSLRTGKTTTWIPPVGPSNGVRRMFGWSSNGRRLAFLYGRCGCRLDVADLGSHKLRQLLGGSATASDVSWSPSSRQLLVTEPDPHHSSCDLLWRLQVSGAKRRVLRGCS